MSTKLHKLVASCQGEVIVTFNTHRSSHHSVEQEIDEMRDRNLFDADLEIANEMIAREAMVSIHFYPDTPVGFYVVHHWDLDLALDRALDILAEARK